MDEVGLTRYARQRDQGAFPRAEMPGASDKSRATLGAIVQVPRLPDLNLSDSAGGDEASIQERASEGPVPKVDSYVPRSE